MKKTLSFVLVLALVLSSFSMAFAGTTATAKTDVPSDVVGTAYEAPVTVLTALGVVNGYEDGTYKPSANVTRAEFAKLIIAELGLEQNAQSSKSTFTDMAGAAWADGYVGYAASLGIINGYGDGRFGPSDNVTHDQALTMIVRALGYTSDCKEMNGTWPAIYVQKARVLGITDDVKAGGAVAANRGDVATYLYNTLTCNMGYANDEGTFVEKKDKDGEYIKVASNLDAEESADYKVITKSDADNSVINIRQYVGAYAKVFTLTKGDNEDDIIAVSDVKSDFVTGEYKADDKVIETADGTEYKLDDIASKGVSGTSSNLKDNWKAYEFENGDTAKAGSTILNDAQDALDVSDDKTIVTIAADLSGKTIKGIYSVAKWYINNDEQVDANDIADIANNKTLLGKDFTLDDNDDAIDTTSFELIGVQSLSDIKADNVVYVYTAGSDDEITRVAVGTQTATGEVTAVKESTGNSKATIGGNTYKFAQEKLTKNGTGADFDTTDIDTEDEITAYLDAYGYMYDYDLTSGGADNYAIVLEVGNGAGIGSNKHEIKLFLADGTDKVFNVDGDLFKNSDVVAGITNTGAGAYGNGWDVTGGAIVKYGLDKDGVIDSFEEIPTTTTDGNDYVLIGKTTAKNSKITDKGYYDNNEIRQDAVIFSSDDTMANITNDEDDYGVSTLDKVLDSSDVDATYVLYKNKIAAMLLYDFNVSDNVYGVVTEAKKTAGDSDYQATFLVNGKEVTYGLSKSGVYDDARNNQKADADAGMDSVFKLEFNASGEVSNLVKAYSDKKDTYATASAYIGTADVTKTTLENNTLFKTSATIKYTTETATSVKLESKPQVYKNKDGDFVTGSTSDLKNLNAGATVYFFDTDDDDNNGLMNLVYIYNPDKETTTPDNPNAGKAGVVTYMDNTNKLAYVGGTAYEIGDATLLKTANGSIIAKGYTNIAAVLVKDDEVSNIIVKDGIVTTFVATKIDSIQTTVAPVDTAIEALPSVDAVTAGDAAAVGAAKTAYDNLEPAEKDFVKSANVTKLNALVAKIATVQDASAAATVDGTIEALPAVASATLANAAAVSSAKTDYDNLSAAQQALVKYANVTKLSDLVAKMTTLQNEDTVATAKTNLGIAGDLNNVVADLTLVATQDGATITWDSSNTAIVTKTGTVTQPNGADVQVTLTATITKGAATATKVFVVTVKGL